MILFNFDSASVIKQAPCYLPAINRKSEVYSRFLHCLQNNPVRVIHSHWRVLCPKMGEIMADGLVCCVWWAHREGGSQTSSSPLFLHNHPFTHSSVHPVYTEGPSYARLENRALLF